MTMGLSKFHLPVLEEIPSEPERSEGRKTTSEDWIDNARREGTPHKRREYLQRAQEGIRHYDDPDERATLDAEIELMLCEIAANDSEAATHAGRAHELATRIRTRTPKRPGAIDLYNRSTLQLIRTEDKERKIELLLAAIDDNQRPLASHFPTSSRMIDAPRASEQTREQVMWMATYLMETAKIARRLSTKDKSLYQVQEKISRQNVDVRHDMLEEVLDSNNWRYKNQHALASHMFELTWSILNALHKEKPEDKTRMALLDCKIETAKQYSIQGLLEDSRKVFRKGLSELRNVNLEDSENSGWILEKIGESAYRIGRTLDTNDERIVSNIESLRAYMEAKDHILSTRIHELIDGERREVDRVKPDNVVWRDLARVCGKAGWAAIRSSEHLLGTTEDTQYSLANMLEEEGYGTGDIGDELKYYTLRFGIQQLQMARQWGDRSGELLSKLGSAHASKASFHNEYRQIIRGGVRSIVRACAMDPEHVSGYMSMLETVLDIRLPKRHIRRFTNIIHREVRGERRVDDVADRILHETDEFSQVLFNEALFDLVRMLELHLDVDLSMDAVQEMDYIFAKQHMEPITTDELTDKIVEIIGRETGEALDAEQFELTRTFVSTNNPELGNHAVQTKMARYHLAESLDAIDESLKYDPNFLTPLFRKIEISEEFDTQLLPYELETEDLQKQLIDHVLDNPQASSRTGLLSRNGAEVVTDKYRLLDRKIVLRMTSNDEIDTLEQLAEAGAPVVKIRFKTPFRAKPGYQWVCMDYGGENLYSQTQRMEVDLTDETVRKYNKATRRRERRQWMPIRDSHMKALDLVVDTNNKLIPIMDNKHRRVAKFFEAGDYVRRFDRALFDNPHVNAVFHHRTVQRGWQLVKNTAEEVLDIELIDRHRFKMDGRPQVYTSERAIDSPLELLRLATVLYIVPALVDQRRGPYSDSNPSNIFGNVIGDKERLKFTHWSEDPSIFLHMRPVFDATDRDMFNQRLFEMSKSGELHTVEAIVNDGCTEYVSSGEPMDMRTIRTDMIYGSVAKMLTLIGHEHKKIGAEIPELDDEDVQAHWYRESCHMIPRYRNHIMSLLVQPIEAMMYKTRRLMFDYDVDRELPCGISRVKGMYKFYDLLSRLHFELPDHDYGNPRIWSQRTRLADAMSTADPEDSKEESSS